MPHLLAFQHEASFVMSAFIVCLATAAVTVYLMKMQPRRPAHVRLWWLCATALTAGAGVWATHFLAVLGYRPDASFGFDSSRILISVFAAIVGVGAPLAVSAHVRQRAFRCACGAASGIGVGAMHHIGMGALQGCIISHDFKVSSLAILIGTGFMTLAADRVFSAGRGRLAVVLLIAAVWGLHFTDIAGSELWTLPEVKAEPHLSREVLGSVAIGIAVVVLASAIAAVIAENRFERSHKQSAELLHRQNEMMRQAQKIARLGFWRWTPENGAFWWSEELYELLGRNRHEFEVTLQSTIECFHEEDRDVTVAKLFATLTEKQEQSHEYRVVKPDGSTVCLWSIARPQISELGEVVEVHGIAQDISERRLIEESLKRSEELSSSILRTSPNSIEVLDLDGRITFVNEAGAQALGLDHPSEIRGQPWLDLWPEEHRPEMEAALDKARQGGTTRFSSRSRPDPQGERRWWEVTVSGIVVAGECPQRLLVISKDNTAEKLASDEAERARGRLARVLESTTDNVIVLNHNWEVTYLNTNAAQLVGRGGKLCVGANIWDIYPDQVGSEFDRRYRLAIASGAPASFEAFLEEAAVWLEVHAYPTTDGISIFFKDITATKKAREDIEYLALHDPLTGLANRARFNQILTDMLASRDRNQIAVFVLDLDMFKEVNDTFGHPVGDALLRQVSDRLSVEVADVGTLARLGGDEFAIAQRVQPQGTDPHVLAERLIRTVMQPFDIDGHSIQVGVSIGIAIEPSEGQAPEDVFKRADVALYKSKDAGRNVFHVYEAGMQEGVVERQKLKQDLAVALERNELEVVYQPILGLETGKVEAVEALLRWKHPSRGLVSPAEFIPLAEQAGLIGSIGEWVLEEACRNASLWPSYTTVAVNISPMQFRDRHLALRVASALSRSGLDPARLELEITESVLLQDSEANLRILGDIDELGVKISLDDFGTGYSSLSYLRKFPFHKIKVDRSFVAEIGTSHQSEAVIKAVAGLANSLNMKTTAEGVEEGYQYDWLASEGISQVQGYYISRPLPQAEIAGFLGVGHAA